MIVNLIRYPRVALFTDCFEEFDGETRTSAQLDRFARQHGLPLLTIHSGSGSSFERNGESRYLQLERSRAAFALDGGRHFDPFLVRAHSKIRQVLDDFRPEVIHVNGPGDAGLLGLYFSRVLGIPMAASWHTNVSPPVTGRGFPYLLKQFYRRAQVVLAPNEDLASMLFQIVRKPVHLVRRGIDSSLFSSSKRLYADGICRIGFAGKLCTEKNVRFLFDLEQALRRKVARPFRFLIVGEGSERSWLESNLRNAEFTGELQGEALARAYGRMDIFAFPSETDTFGSAVLQAMASGTPAVVMCKGGSRFFVEHNVSGFVCSDRDQFIQSVASLLANRELRRRMAFESCVHARRWSWDSICEATYRAYRVAVRSMPPLAPTKLHAPPPTPCPAI
jgi:phosphatidylinositol alpha 1,6-mannosyltransferase